MYFESDSSKVIVSPVIECRLRGRIGINGAEDHQLSLFLNNDIRVAHQILALHYKLHLTGL